jgi:hypothetical protein
MKSATLRRTPRALGIAVGVFLIAVSLFAQANFGRILGTGTDQTGAVLAGAKVTVIDTERGSNRVLTTDAAGEYNAPTLIPGTYTVRVEANGFKRLERPGILLEVGKELRVDVTPQPGDQTQTVTVTEAIPLVDATSATLGGTLSNAEINDLPLNGRNYQQLLGLRPGVMLQPGGSPWTQSTNNVRPDETVWMVDGIYNANFFDSRPVANMPSPFTDMATILPVDAIQAFDLQENPKAEYGWKPGAVVNVGVRSGTNSLHGSAYAFGRDQNWDARNYFNTVPNPILPTELKQFGGVAGGPIKKDKMFFFGGYEGMRTLVGNAFGATLPQTAPAGGNPANSMADAIAELNGKGIALSPLSLKMLGCSPSGACTGGYLPNLTNSTSFISTFPNVNTSDNGIGKLDYNINDKNRISGLFLTGHYLANGIDHVATNQLFTDNVIQTTYTISASYIWTPSSRLVNEARFGYNRITFLFDPADLGTKADGTGYPINTGSTAGGFPSVSIAGFSNQSHGQLLGSYQGRPLDSTPNPYWDLQDSVSYLMGKHSLKFGFEFAHIEADQCGCDNRGVISFRGNKAFAGSTPLEDYFAGLPTFANLLTGRPNVRMLWTNSAPYVQDDWRVTSKLMINLGLRYQYATPMHEATNHIGNFLPSAGLVQQGQSGVGSTLFKSDPKDFSPRIGMAYDLTGKGTTVIRAGFSVIYTTFNIADFTGNPTAQNVPGGLSLASDPTGACTTAVGIGQPCPQTYGGTIGFGKVTIPGSALNWNGVVYPQGVTFSCTPGKPCNAAAIDPNLKTPYVINWNVDVQHQLGSNYSLEVGYVANHGGNQLGILDINQTNPATGVQPFAAQYPYLNYINKTVNDSHSNYHSLQTTLTKRLSHGFNFTAGYTYGHGLDNGSLNRFNNLPQNSLAPGLEYGNSDYDTRHRFSFQGGWDIPGKKGFGQMLQGWKINGIWNWASGQPWLVDDTGNNFSGSNDYADRWDFFGNPGDFKSSAQSLPFCTGPGNCSVLSGESGIQSSFSPAQSASMWAQCTAAAPDPSTLAVGGCYVKGKSVMVPPKAGTFGTMGRNLFRDPGFINVDFSVFKNWTFHERYIAQFRVEFFNLFNHPNLANPYGGVVNSALGNDPSVPGSFGCGCATPDIVNGNPILGSGDARLMQLGFKFSF